MSDLKDLASAAHRAGTSSLRMRQAKGGGGQPLVVAVVIVLVAIAGVAVYVVQFGGAKGGGSNVPGVKMHRLKEGYIAAISEGALDRANRLAIAKETEALARMESGGLFVITKAGTEVSIERRTEDGTVQVRPKGETTTMWVRVEALE